MSTSQKAIFRRLADRFLDCDSLRKVPDAPLAPLVMDRGGNVILEEKQVAPPAPVVLQPAPPVIPIVEVFHQGQDQEDTNYSSKPPPAYSPNYVDDVKKEIMEREIVIEEESNIAEPEFGPKTQSYMPDESFSSHVDGNFDEAHVAGVGEIKKKKKKKKKKRSEEGELYGPQSMDPYATDATETEAEGDQGDGKKKKKKKKKKQESSEYNEESEVTREGESEATESETNDYTEDTKKEKKDGVDDEFC